MINVGRLRKRIIILHYAEVENEMGHTETKLVPLKTVWAEVRPLRGKEYVEANMLDATTTYRVTIRYFSGLTEEMYIEYNGQNLAITSICDIEMRHKYYEIMCVEDKKKKPKKEVNDDRV